MQAIEKKEITIRPDPNVRKRIEGKNLDELWVSRRDGDMPERVAASGELTAKVYPGGYWESGEIGRIAHVTDVQLTAETSARWRGRAYFHQILAAPSWWTVI